MQTEISTKQGHVVKQNAKSTTVKVISSSILGLFVMMVVASCTKNAIDAPGQNKMQESITNKSATSKSNNGLMEVPFEDTLFVPCSNGGAGERIAISGNVHYVYQMAWNNEGFHLVYHENSRQIIGIGLTTGDRFVGSDGMQGTVNASWAFEDSNAHWVGTTVSKMSLVGKGANFSINYKDKLVVSPDGTVVVDFTERTIDCK